MAKETEERLIRALEFLKEPHGSTISTLVKAMNGDGPQVSLKKIVQTLRGCLENGILKVSDGRVKLKQLHALSDSPKEQKLSLDERPKSGCMKPACQTKTSSQVKTRSSSRRSWNSRGQKFVKGLTLRDCRDPCEEGEVDGECGGGCDAAEGAGGGEGGGEGTECPECPECKKVKRKPKCPKPKPKCPKPKPKCPKPKPKCKKPKPKCKKPKPKKPKKKCGKRIKIQPYCKKKKCPT